MSQPDGPCGCVGMHPGESHAAHVDALWRRQNATMLVVVMDETQPAIRRWLALWGMAGEEAARLGEKGQMMEAGR